MRKLTLALIAAFALAGPAAGAAAGPTVVELFTSQGCSSCPPADAFLGELARRDDVLALSFHVDYWDYIGWKDPFASHANTQRQRKYADDMGLRYVYTPQMVIQGTLQAVGSRRDDVLRDIKRAKDLPRVAVGFRRQGKGRAVVSVAAASGADDPATVWVVSYDPEHRTDVRRGENSGRSLTDYNVVRSLRAVAAWKGAALTAAVDLADDDSGRRYAVLLQSDRNGHIVGAATLSPAGDR